jgi:glycosyltransferase involved in cell wall biosynthesis
MNEIPMFAIVTVTKNDLISLIRSRESIEKQTFHSWLHIIIDAKSIDGTVSYCQNLPQGNTIFISETDSGIYNAMNKGWKLAPQAAYVIYLNAGDTFASNNALENAHEELIRHRLPPWGCTTHEEISQDGEIWYSKRVSTPNIRNQLYAYGYRSHQGVLMQKNLIESLNGFDEKYEIASDWDLIVRAMLRVKPIEWNSALIRFELGGLSSIRILQAHEELYQLRKQYLLSTRTDYFLDYLWKGIYLRNLGYSNFFGKFLTAVFSVQKALVYTIHIIIKPLSFLYHYSLKFAGEIYRFLMKRQKSDVTKPRNSLHKIFRVINNVFFLNINYASVRLIHKLLKIEDLK